MSAPVVFSHLHTKDDGLYIGSSDDPESATTKVLAGWESFSGWYWFATEIGEDGIHFGYVQGNYEEWGSFSQTQLDHLIRQGIVWKIKDCDLPHAGRRY